MKNVKRKWDLLAEERRNQCIKEIITYFKEEKNEEIGMIAAENFLDFFLEMTGKDIYNKAISDSKSLLKKYFENMEVDLDLLLDK